MNEAIKQMWLDALRSGAYTQGQGRLRTLGEDGKYRHCCLGVLCDLHSKATGGEWVEEQLVTSYRGAYEFLPFDVRTWAGLHDDSPDIGGRSLVAWNDGSDDGEWPPVSFAQIADLIEAHL